jgi:hypothetical protein
MAGSKFDWTDDRIKRALQMRDAGYSARDIGELFGITRCAVLGKFHRLKLEKKAGSK